MKITDAARACEVLYTHFSDDLVQMFRCCEHGRYLVDIGLEEDLKYCAQRNVTDLVPAYRAGEIGLMTNGTLENSLRIVKPME